MFLNMAEHRDERYSTVKPWQGNGFPIQIFTEENVRYRTPLFCSSTRPPTEPHVLRDPVQLQCGHRYCRQCVEDLRPRTQGQRVDCKYCKLENEMDDEQLNLDSRIDFDALTPDFIVSKEIDKLHVSCIYKCGAETSEALKIKNLWDHMCDECELRNVKCKRCSEEMSVKDFDHHYNNTCPNRIVPCPYKCGTSGLKDKDLEAHSYYCPAKPTLCNFCGKGMYHGMEKHMKECKAPCPLGCEGGKPLHMKKHMSDPKLTWLHMKFLISAVPSRKFVSRQAAGRDSSFNHSNAMGRLLQVQARLNGMKDKIAELIQSKECDSTQAKEKAVHLLNSISDSLEPKVALRKSKEVMDALKQDVQLLSVMEQEYSQLQQAILKSEQEVHNSIDKLSKEMTERDTRLQSQKHMYDRYQKATYDGKFLWRVEEVNQLREDAMSMEEGYIVSNPFYTDKYGYKMCLRLWINGTQSGAGTHASVELVLMKGDFDPILKWPFLFKVELRLLELTNKPHHSWSSDDATTDRPTEEMNKHGVGNHQFIRHDELFSQEKAYIRSDAMYIYAVVTPIENATTAVEQNTAADTKSGAETTKVKP